MDGIASAHQLRPPVALTPLRLRLLANGYRPVPVSGPAMRGPSPGKRPVMKNWRKVCAAADEAEVKRWEGVEPGCTNTGILCGDLACLDIDVLAPDLAADLAALAENMLGATPLRRIGKAPKLALFYRSAEPLKKMETPELLLDGDQVAQVEILGDGQQVVAFGIHPTTGQPYAWPDQTPETVPLADLPLVTGEALQSYRTAAEAMIRAAGGKTEKERQAPPAEAEPWPGASDGEPPPERAPQAARKANGAREYCQEVNRRALANIGAWLPAIFPSAREETGTGAWRVSSADMGRNLEEDLSIHPTQGGKDWGTRKSYSPINIVIAHAHAKDWPDAAEWLCERLGITPEDCGAKPKAQRKDRGERMPAASKGPLIRLAGGRLHHEATAGETALLTARKPIYQRGAALVRPAVHLVPASRGRTTHSACLIEVTAHGLIDNLCAVANWERFDARSEEWMEVNPPMAVAQTILSRAGEWRFSRIAGVITTPTLRPDGTILSEPGYDEATRLYHMADPDLKLHPAVHKPTRADAEKALKLLQGLLAEFPFTDDIGRAVALSGMLTPVVRGALSVVPLHAFKAYTAGTGKSYLADICSAISTGRPCPVASAAPDEAETEKRIAGLLLAGYPIASLDNVNGELGGDLLCQAIERPLIRIRPLGRSDIIEIESRATLFATGNALRVRGDMTRRTIVCSLDAGVERPELREFNGDPVAKVMQDRGLYVSACLIIVRAYAAAGCPGLLKPIASFEDWSGAVRSALVWLGCADPAASMEAAREDDPELAELREIVGLWRDAFGVTDSYTVRDIASLVQQREDTKHGEPTDYAHPELREALLRMVGERGEINSKRFGRWLMNREGRIVDGHRIRRDSISAQGSVVRWRVEPAPGPRR